MNRGEPWRSSNAPDMSGTYSRLMKEGDNLSVTSSKKSNYENMNADEILADQRQKIQKLQLKDANYRKKEAKLTRDSDYLKKQIGKLEVTIEKLEDHREQDAEALLEQEQKLSKLKGKYRKSDNPHEVSKMKKNIQKLTKDENEVMKEVRNLLENITGTYQDMAEMVPAFYEELRRLKFYGDKQMNEILLRQIHIYVEQVQEKAREYEKQKAQKLEENKALRQRLKEKYKEHDELKKDAIEDYKQLYSLQRKLNFYESDYIIESEQKDKLE